MFVEAARVLSDFSPVLNDPDGPLYPPLESVREISRNVALAVGVEAQRVGLARPTCREELERNVTNKMWQPRYVPLTPDRDLKFSFRPGFATKGREPCAKR
jgi:malate dehydrogenase (oxaloacetate-decarboxylating)